MIRSIQFVELSERHVVQVAVVAVVVVVVVVLTMGVWSRPV